MQEILPYVLEVEGQEVILTPDPAHEFTATTEQVALGYGVTPDAIRMVKSRRAEELLEGKHYCVTDRYAPGDGQLTLWTKRGMVRLGFFIRSKRARLFRDMAEDLVIQKWGGEAAPQPTTAPALLSARQIGEALGCSNKSAMNRLSHHSIKPTHHFFEPRCAAPAYLFPLDIVQSVWPAAVFTPFAGEAHAGVLPVAQAIAAQNNGKTAKEQQPHLLPTDTVFEQLARRLLSIEAQKREILRQLAVAS